MRLLFLSIFLIVNLLGAKDCKAQTGTFIWTNGAPTTNPGASGARFAVDRATFRWYEWVSGTSWVQSGDRIQRISGCSAPAYTPTIHNAYFVVNGCTEPEFYYWNGTAWKLLNGGGGATYTAGSGIAISGTNVISNTAPNVNQTISTSGSAGNITLSNGGGTLNLNVNDADASPTNEIQTLSTNGNAGNITLSNGGGTVNINVNDGDSNASNELQSLSLSGLDLEISSGNTVTLPPGGIYGGSGVVPPNTDVTITDILNYQAFDDSSYPISPNRQRHLTEYDLSSSNIRHTWENYKPESGNFFRLDANGNFIILNSLVSFNESLNFTANKSELSIQGNKDNRDDPPFAENYIFSAKPETGFSINTLKSTGNSNIKVNVGEIELRTEVSTEAINGIYGFSRALNEQQIKVSTPNGTFGLVYENDNSEQIKSLGQAITDVNTVNKLKQLATVWTTATRPTTTSGEYPLGFNTDLGSLENYDGTSWYAIPKIIKGSATLNFPSTGAHSSSDLTVTVTGAAIRDGVVIHPDPAAILANSCYTAWVSATNTVTVRYNHYGSGSSDPASNVFDLTIIKR
jgi:hypothetical protein